jgi:cation diffusion facilitator CzcD-associated flavoprotein CzcO
MATTKQVDRSQPRILVIGAGMSGILMCIRLKKAGYENVSIFEKAEAVGGTWRDNTYPGLHCDVPSLSYCYSFAPRDTWDKRMSAGEDIRQYFERVSKEYGVQKIINFNTEVTNSVFKDGVWKVDTNHEKGLEFDFVITACGVLHHPVIPDFKGKDTFEGDSFHTARWDHSVDMKGKRMGVIGTGSTAAQIIKPASETCTQVVNFQRTPQWIFPFPNREYKTTDKLFAKHIPGFKKLVRGIYDEAFDHGGLAVTKNGWERRLIQNAVRLNLRFAVKDPELRKKLTPDYEPLCKRMVISDNYYQSLQKDNVHLETSKIVEIQPKGILCEDGTFHELDIIVFATGFDTQAYMRPIKMQGLNGSTLEKAWTNGPVAYRTIAMPDFPNMFMIQGPNAPVGNFSLISTAESQTKYIMKCLEHYKNGDFDSMAPKHSACDKFNSDLVEAMQGTVWMSGCSSWYISDAGIPLSWPWGPREFRDSMRKPDFSEYEFV